MKHIRIVNTIVFLLAITSCTKYSSLSDTSSDYQQESGVEFTLASFGPQTGHPFSMANVLIAFNNLPEETRAGVQEGEIQPTHKYVRFIPTCYKEMDSVQSHTEIDIYQYPLDCEITEGFVGIDNPFIINGFPQYWCVVPYDYDLDVLQCPYEIEDELWMPPTLLNIETKTNHSDFDSALLEELFSEQGLYNGDGLATRANEYYPGGYVKYYDSILGVMGIVGMVVEAYTFWHNYKATSGSYGQLNYSGHSFAGSFRYRIKFKREDFAIRSEDNNSDLEYVTNNMTTHLNQTFSGAYAKYCVVFQAAQRYYYQPLSIPRPPQNGFWDACLRISVYPNTSEPNGNGWSGCYNIESGLFADRPVITIWGYGNSGEYSPEIIYGTSIHELTHAMHYEMDEQLYRSSIESKVKESLARGVEVYLSKERYSTYPSYNLYYCVNRYTGIMRDLVDGEKTVVCNYYEDDNGNPGTNPSSNTYDDEIDSAYTIPELVEAVRTCTTPIEWYLQIVSLYPGRVVYNDLYTAFDFWFDL